MKPKETQEKLHQALTNLEEMINSKLYNAFIELTDLRGEVRRLRMLLFELEQEKGK